MLEPKKRKNLCAIPPQKMKEILAGEEEVVIVDESDSDVVEMVGVMADSAN